MEATKEGIFVPYSDVERGVRIAGYIGLTLFTIRVIYCLVWPMKE